MIELKTQSNHSYPIVSEPLAGAWTSAFLKEKKVKKVYLISDESVWKYHGQRIQDFIEANQIQCIGKSIVASGERSKSVQEWARLTDELLTADVKRNDAVFVFGGGVTGDLGGFSASTALRGIALWHFPTTLLAMVDSSIGGKTGINHVTGKNRIGAFYQPEAVICDTQFLDSLPEKEWFCGLGEILKYGCISDPEIFSEASQILKSDSPFEHRKWESLILKSAQIKANIVAADEKEQGIRAFLNYGHTFAHALEHELGYGTMSHGDAVFWGCIAATELSRLKGNEIENELEDFIPFYKSRFVEPESIEKLIEAMKSDKKNKSDAITFVLLKATGQAYLDQAEWALIERAWQFMLSKAIRT